MNRWFSHCYRVLATPNIYQPYLQYTVRILSMPLSKLFSFLVSFQQTNAKCTSIISILSIIKNADKASHRPARHGGQILFASTHVGNIFVMLLRSSRFLNKGMESPYIVPQMDQFTMGFTSSPSKAENFPKYINHQLEEIWFENLQAWTKSFWASQFLSRTAASFVEILVTFQSFSSKIEHLNFWFRFACRSPCFYRLLKNFSSKSFLS